MVPGLDPLFNPVLVTLHKPKVKPKSAMLNAIKGCSIHQTYLRDGNFAKVCYSTRLAKAHSNRAATSGAGFYK